MVSTMSTDELKAELSRLDDRVRAELAKFLIESLGSPPALYSPEEWHRELERRRMAIEDGTAVGEPMEVVMDRLKEKHS
jgi:hypothetical protein